MSTMQHAYTGLLESLGELRRRWRARQVVTGGLLTTAVIGATLGGLVAADNLGRFDTFGRALLALPLWLVTVAAILGLVVKRWLEDHRDDFFAALVESKHPTLNNRLINALQLGRGNQTGHSPRLIQAIISDAADATADIELADSIDPKPLQHAASAFGVVMLALVAYAAIAGPRFTNGLTRVLLPFADIPAYSATRVPKVEPGNTRVPEGVTVEVLATLEGVLPQTATLNRRGADGRWQAILMQSANSPKSGQAVFKAVLPQVTDSFEYTITAGDGQSKRFRVEAVKRPAVENLTVRTTLPAYTGAAVSEPVETDGSIEALTGSSVEVTLRATKPLKAAQFVTEAGEAISLTAGKDLTVWSGSFVPWSSAAEKVRAERARTGQPPVEVSGQKIPAPTRYQIQLTDTEGYDNADPLWRSLALKRDAAPTAVITRPGRDVQVKPDGTVGLTIEAQDDLGLAGVRLLYRVNDDPTIHELARFAIDGTPRTQASQAFEWKLTGGKFKAGDLVQYWAEATDRNDITGPGVGESRRFTLFVIIPEQVVRDLDQKLSDMIEMLERLLKLQKDNRQHSHEGKVAARELAAKQIGIRAKTSELARIMERDGTPIATVIKELDDLAAGLMAQAVKLLESARDADDPDAAAKFRGESVPVQDRIIAQLEAMLARLQRNEQAQKELKKLARTDKVGHDKLTAVLSKMIHDLDAVLKDSTELASKFERLPKKTAEELKEEQMQLEKDLEEFKRRVERWSKASVNEMTKLGQGFVDDFNLRKDVNTIFEEVEKQANRPKASELPVALEDMGVGLATKMKEDLEMWLMDAPDSVKWVMEEPNQNKPIQVPEMPLPKDLQDLIGDLLQKAEEFDEDADDVTSAWADNMDQAGWGVMDGPISSFSAKGKTGNDQPNSQEVTGRSGDGRRGKSAGQMVGDSAKALPGRKTPARVGNERYEPGQVKQEGSQDPNGATGGGKKSGAGRKGLQGGSPPDATKDIGRLSEKEAGMREKAEQVAQKLDALGLSSGKLREGIELLKRSQQEMRDLRYDDAAKRRKEGLGQMRSALSGLDQATAAQISRNRDLPPQLRGELIQAADEGYPAGYEPLLKSYFKALSTAEGK